MTAAELDRIKATLGYSLPDHYCRFMLAYPPALAGLHDRFGRRLSSWALCNYPGRLVLLNRSVRRRGRLFGEMPWPDHMLVVGGDDYNSFHTVHFGDGTERVWLLAASDDNFYPVADSLAGFAEMLAGGWPK